MAPADPITLTQTFLFTDIEGSTRLWERDAAGMQAGLARHDALLADAISGAHGRLVKSTGDGVLACFMTALDALAAALAAQRALAVEPAQGPWLRVRMGLHSGEAESRDGDVFGPAVNRAARLMAAGHGGQMLVSEATAGLLVGELPDGVTLRDLGQHRLKDLSRPEHVFQVVAPPLPADFPSLATVDRRPNNLPSRLAPLVGRMSEAAAIRSQLEDREVRLLTLTGPGGTGKTSLALQVAAEQIDAFTDGVFFVDLAPTRDVPSVVSATARAVGLAESGDRPVLDDLTDRLRDQRTLLLLDNFEQVTQAAPTAARLLSDCPELKLLVTSREALHVRGEHLFPVPPLAVPHTADRATAASLGQFEAIQLFVDRARAVWPDFRLTDDNAAAIADICRRLDGLPLAIELAAARLGLFTPETLRDRLSDRLGTLRSGPRDLPDRQQTLRGAIDWSYQLLGSSEQRLFERLAVFATASIDAVEAVTRALDSGRAGPDVLDDLASLLDKSLLRRETEAPSGDRVAMLGTIRDFAAERLAERGDDAEAAARAHADWFATFARERRAELGGATRETALQALAIELENLRAAWRYWLARADLDRLNDLVISLWRLFDARGWYHDSLELASELLGVLDASPPTPDRTSQLITLRTSLARTLLAIKGYTPEVEAAYTQALALFDAAGDLPPMYPVLRGLASYYTYRGDFEKANQVGHEILRLADEQDDSTMRVDGHLVVGASLLFNVDMKLGVEHLETAIRMAEERPTRTTGLRLGSDPHVTSLAVAGLARWMLGDPDQSIRHGRGAVDLARRLEHPFSIAYANFHVGLLHHWRREPEATVERAATVLATASERDLLVWRAIGLCLHGAAAAELGDGSAGLAEVDRGIELYQAIRTPPVFWPVLQYLRAGACARAGRPDLGLAAMAEAFAVGGDRGALAAELFVRQGDLLAATTETAAQAEAWFRRALDDARASGARMVELRASTRLGRLALAGGDAEAAGQLVEASLAMFDEGHDLPDVRDARALLAASR